MKPRILSDLNFHKSKEQLGELPADIALNEKFYEGDHWQDGAGWMGPRPAEGEGDAMLVLQRIQLGFVSKNIIKEIVDRVVTAVLGRDPDWAFARRSDNSPSMTPKSTVLPFPKTPKPAPVTPPVKGAAPPAPGTPPAAAGGAPPEQDAPPPPDPLVEEANKLMMDWWSSPDKQLLKQMQAVLRKRLWGARGYLRLFVPFAYLEEGGEPKKYSIEEWAKHLYPDTPPIKDAALMEDIATMERVGLVKIPAGGFGEQFQIELSYLDDDDKTVIVILSSGGNEADTAASEVQATATAETEDDLEVMKDELNRSVPLELMGHLPLYELKGDPIITAQVRQCNMLVNEALTMLGHNVVEAGFSELVLTNVELEKTDIPDPNAEGGVRHVSKNIRRGASVVHNFVGKETEDDDGKVTRSTPGVHYHEPSPVQTFTDTKREGYVCALEETHQMHALLSGDAAPSGESRIQALTDFASDCHQYKAEVDAMGIWVLETALAWLAQLAGNKNKFDDLRATFSTRVYVGKLSAEERAAIISQYAAGLISRTSAMVLLEVADPDAEVEKIFADKARQAELDAANAPQAIPPRAIAPGATRPGSKKPGAPAAVKLGKGTIPLDAGSESQWHSALSG